jgi:hippurate hydrolase
MEEQTNLPYRSTSPGVFHGCGHDGHTAMLLGAAKYLAETRGFDGDVVFIFQPAEEGLGGARAMLADGLFEKFPCDEIYALHNSPYDAPNKVGIKPGVAMAGADFFDYRIIGRGSHGAMPQMSRDPVIVATALVQALQTIVSRNADPKLMAVLSVTKIQGGNAYNVIPNEVTLGGGVRFFSLELRDLIRERMKALAVGMEASYGVEVQLDIRDVFDVLVNDEPLSHTFLDVAKGVMGDENVFLKEDPVAGSEDFADMLRVVPGAYFTVGHKGDVPLHNPGFIFDDDSLPVGATLFARIAEARLAAG